MVFGKKNADREAVPKRRGGASRPPRSSPAKPQPRVETDQERIKRQVKARHEFPDRKVE